MCSKQQQRRRWILYGWSCGLVSLAAGLIYGWPALRQELIQDGSHLSESQLGAVFTVGAWSAQGSRLLAGLARDRYGTRSTVAVCLVAVALGSLGMGLADPNHVASLSLSVLAMGFGSGIILCVLPVADLFPQSAGTIMSSLSGCFQISGLVFWGLTSVGSREATFLGFAGVLVLFAGLVLYYLPKDKSFVLLVVELSDDDHGDTDDLATTSKRREQPQGDEEEVSTQEMERHASAILSDVPLEEDPPNTTQQEQELPSSTRSLSSERSGSKENTEDNPSTPIADSKEEHMLVVMRPGPNEHKEDNQHINTTSPSVEDCDDEDATKPPTAMQQLKSIEYILLCTWFSICLIPLQFYVGSIGFQLEDKGDEDGFYADMFSFVYAGVSILAPLGGYLADHLGLGVTQGLATGITAGSFFILAWNRSLDGAGGQIIASLVLYGIGRLFVFGMYFSNTGKRFGYDNYGTLAGIGLLISALVSLLQYPLIALAADGHALPVNLGLGILLLSLLPYAVWLDRRERSERHG